MNNTDLIISIVKARVDADLWNVIDTEYHYILISKLMPMGIDEPVFLPWFRSFLVGRKQWIKIGNNISG